MSISLQQLIDESILQAKRGLDPNTVIDPLVAESLLPTVFQQVGIDCAKDERKRSLLRREKTITFSGGTATVTSDVFTQYAEDSLLYDSADTSTEYSWCRNWSDFAHSDDSLLGRYSFNGSTIGILEPNEVYDPMSGTSANRKLVIPCAPEIPTLSTDDIDVVDEIASDLIVGLAESLRGAIVKEAVEAT